MREKKRLGEMLIEAGIIDEMQLTAALGQQKQWGGKLGSKLIEMGFVDEQAVASVLEKQLGVTCVYLEGMEIPLKAIHAVKHEVVKKYGIMPLELDKNMLTIAMSDPTDVKTLDDLGFLLGVRIKPVLALDSDIKKTIARYYEGAPSTGKAYKVDLKNITEKMQLTKTEPSAPAQTEKMQEKPAEKKEITSKTVIDALVALLIEKKIINREELFKKLEEKSRESR